jgi:hypothetical protein
LSNITEVSRPTQWKSGQSGNLNGRPVGTRQAFSAGFYRDLAEVFAKHGRTAMEKKGLDQPSAFFGICARLLHAETRLTSGLDPDNWSLLRGGYRGRSGWHSGCYSHEARRGIRTRAVSTQGSCAPKHRLASRPASSRVAALSRATRAHSCARGRLARERDPPASWLRSGDRGDGGV